MSEVPYQYRLTIAQAENDIETGKRTGNRELVRAAEKRIAAANAAGAPQEKKSEE